jgi:hypothetical protein
MQPSSHSLAQAASGVAWHWPDGQAGSAARRGNKWGCVRTTGGRSWFPQADTGCHTTSCMRACGHWPGMQRPCGHSLASGCLLKHSFMVQASPGRAARRDSATDPATHWCKLHKSSAGTGQSGRLPELQRVGAGLWVGGGRGQALTGMPPHHHGSHRAGRVAASVCRPQDLAACSKTQAKSGVCAACNHPATHWRKQHLASPGIGQTSRLAALQGVEINGDACGRQVGAVGSHKQTRGAARRVACVLVATGRACSVHVVIPWHQDAC